MDDYWRSPRGWAHRYRDRLSRLMMVVIQQEPTAKNLRGKRTAADFRRAVREQLPPGSYRPRAKLAVDLCFVTSDPRPPLIEQLAKHYLDQLGRGLPPSEPLLYPDDENIKMLHVTSFHSQDAHGRIVVWCRTRADAVNELRDAANLRKFLDDKGAVDETEDHLTSDDYLDMPHIFSRSPENNNPTSLLADMRAFEAWYADWEHDKLKRNVLKQNDLALEWLLQAYGSALITGSDPDEVRLARLRSASEVPRLEPRDVRPGAADQARDTLRRTLIQVPLPPLPDRGGSERFREQLDEAFHKFLAQWQSLIPFATPLAITILLVQPEGRSERDNVTRDLDNVALQVLGLVRKHLTQDRATRRDLIASYQVIELARSERDGPSGLLTVILGAGHSGAQSMWRRAQAWIDQNVDSNVRL